MVYSVPITIVFKIQGDMSITTVIKQKPFCLQTDDDGGKFLQSYKNINLYQSGRFQQSRYDLLETISTCVSQFGSCGPEMIYKIMSTNCQTDKNRPF